MALVRKILETTLTAGQTSVSFNDADIASSLLRLYTTDPDIFPTSQTLSGNVLSVDFEAQASNMGVALEIVKQGLIINDTLTSDDDDVALSAKQGKALKTLIDNLNIPEELTDLDDIDISSIQDGQVLAWDSVEQKFKNVDQSGGGSEVTITPSLLSGTKVADYSIDGVSGSLYAPSGGGSTVTITPELLTGTKVADYSIDGVSGSLYAPDSSVIYSTSEQKIGKWIDNSDVYRRVVNIGTFGNNSYIDYDITSWNVSKGINIYGTIENYGTVPKIQTDSNLTVTVFLDGNTIKARKGNQVGSITGNVYIVLEYTKTT